MALLSTRSVVMALSIAMTSAKPGEFYTNPDMNHRRLPNPLPDGVKSPIQDRSDCEDLCSNHDICDSYAYSDFYKTCMIYQVKLGERAIIHNMYQLYIIMKSDDDGYIQFGTDYLKIILKMQNKKEATAECAGLGGSLVSIKSAAMTKKLKEEIKNRMVSAAFIGLSDEVKEMSWVFADGTPVGDYDNWEWNGVWERKDRNCAIIGLAATWFHTNCLNKFYSICQIPMF